MSQPAGTDRRTNYAREETMTFGEKFNYKMDQFRDIVSGACCSCLGNCPSIALIITTLLIILTIVAGVAYTIINTSSSKLSSDFTEVALKSKRVKFWPSVDKIGMPLNGDLKNELRGISMESLFPSNVSMCTGFGFACTDSVYTSIATSKRCDGKHDCGDKSDEENCKECQTIFSCPARVINDVEKLKLRRNKNYKPTLICLTASQLCDGVQHCPDGSDETEFCKATCSEKEFKCNGRNICLPLSSRCNGVNDCDDGSDELECKTCHSGSHLCGNKCIESNKLCDGVSDCEDGSDEMKCDCKTCSGTDKALCDDGTCILRSQVCDGRNDCSDGMDERDCPGSCLMTSFNVSKITCSDGRDYTREEACSGEFEVCESSCDRCDPKLAFECPNTTTDKRKCIPRRMICDGIKDCFDGADEMNCECDIESGSQFKCLNSRTCIDKERRCDGVFDCHDGSDEKECSKCDSSSLRCESDRSCLPASSRCNGIVDCSDGSDEKNCSCEECVGKHSTTYLCEGSSRCLRRDEVCSPYSMCPNATRTDKAYCASMALKLSDKLPW